jgi:hypothetical protein
MRGWLIDFSDGNKSVTTKLLESCPVCGLLLLSGAIFDAAARADEIGPILGLHREARPDEARAGYVGISSLRLGDAPEARDFYRCPRCKADCLRDVLE